MLQCKKKSDRFTLKTAGNVVVSSFCRKFIGLFFTVCVKSIKLIIFSNKYTDYY